MSLQDDIFDIDGFLQASGAEMEYFDAFENICRFLNEIEEERDKLLKENKELNITIKTILKKLERVHDDN